MEACMQIDLGVDALLEKSRAATAESLATLAGERQARPTMDRPTMDKVKPNNPMQDRLHLHIAAAAERHRAGLPMVPRSPFLAGRQALIVGTGPSLDHPHVWRRITALVRGGAVVVGLKEAITLLRRRGLRVDYSVSVDAQPNQVLKTPAVPGVTYLVATCCAPALFDHLLTAACSVQLFHTACGAVDPASGAAETMLYASLFSDGWVAQGGMVVANRAIALMHRAGCRHIFLAGCDFGRRATNDDLDEVVQARDFYAAGTRGNLMDGAVFFNDRGAIDGRPWITQPGMKVSAQHVAGLIRAGYVTVIGDSLAKSVARHWDSLSAQGAERNRLAARQLAA
jgi:hypothetical protein